ncbi:MAG: nitrogenase cofactor biosynthesis protein NifB [Methanomethylovorans sp.]|jgi:nitrogen fixation protein NifB|nr:nitrogenase cofactor biosynthesis protein NifB [Methanomethylovorans sp.]
MSTEIKNICDIEVSNKDEEMKRIIAQHPCYSKEAQHKFGRIHLPVAPACNIQCNYCDRKFDCVNESRPGVTSEVLTPEEALEKTKQVLEEFPFIKVVAVAGPGDPLANDTTFETFRHIKAAFPEVTLCLSTNGLALPDRMPEIIETGVDTLTVTLNAIDPAIEAQLISHIIYKGKIYKGIEAAEILIKNQLAGIKMAVDAGIIVKINTVMVPGINDKHVVEVAKKVNEMGVYIMNIMPLICQAKFADMEPPTPEERLALQNACEPYVRQMKHCRQCRSDAFGLIGKDLSQMSEERRNTVKLEMTKLSKKT